MTTKSFPIKTGDRLPKLQFIPVNPDGSDPDLTGATVVFNMTGPDGTAVVNRAAVTVVDVTVGAEVRKAFEYDWQTGDTSTSGLHRAEFEATFPGGRALTYPNRGFITIDISADLG